MIDFDQIMTTMGRLVASAMGGQQRDRVILDLGIEPAALDQAGREAAEEEFALLPGMPEGVPAEGRLRSVGLSARQRKLVQDTLDETFCIAFIAGVQCVREEQAS